MADATLSPPISRRFSSDPMEVREALIATMSELEAMGLTQEERGTVELVMAEVLNNIAEHAYEERHDGVIELDIERKGTNLFCKLRDFGQPMPDGKTPLGLEANLNVPFDELPEGGFGWFLIGELANDLVYSRLKDANHLSFRMVIGA